MRAFTLICWLSVWLGAAIVPFSSARAGEAECGPLKTPNHYGPFDYVNPEHYKKKLPIVEAHHFNFRTETLTGGTSGSIMSDLDYTLRAFPNHHRALYAMARYQLKNGRPGEGSPYLSIECYFDRAKRMNPRDPDVYAIDGWYLRKRGDLKAALAQYRKSEKLKPVDVARDYDMGLLLFDMKRYDEARKYAERAYKHKFPDDALREKLKSVNHWGAGG